MICCHVLRRDRGVHVTAVLGDRGIYSPKRAYCMAADLNEEVIPDEPALMTDLGALIIDTDYRFDWVIYEVVKF